MTTPTPAFDDFLSSLYDDNRVENGTFCHFTFDGEPVFLDGPDRQDPQHPNDPSKRMGGTQPVGAVVRSILCTHYAKMGEDNLKKMSNQARKIKSASQRQLVALQEMKEQQPKACSVLIVEFVNVSKVKPGPITPPPSDIIHWALQPKNKDWVEQVIEHAGEAKNYGGAEDEAVVEGNADGGVSTADPSQASS